MNLLKTIFSKKDDDVQSYKDFWNWFQKHEKAFFKVVKKQKDIEKDFFDKLSTKLEGLKDGYYYLTGMLDDHTVELVLTADGNPKNIVFVEELGQAAPQIAGWKFTTLKPPMSIESVGIEMAGYQFSSENISFYANDMPGYPDEIDITIVYNDMNEQDKTTIENGVYIFLDNYLGELDFLTTIDNLSIVGPKEAQHKLVPIGKLKDFLRWRQKEFVEKYEAVKYDTENDTHSIFEAEMDNGNNLLAVINTSLLEWDCKASHPWVSILKIKYDGTHTNGMPDEEDYDTLNELEESLLHELKPAEGYLNIGRQTAKGEREIYFACKDFRAPSKVFYKVRQAYNDRFDIDYDIYKDKYWQSFERFSQNPELT